MVAEVDPSTLAALEAALLNKQGNVPLHNRFRALFTLKSLKNDDAVKIISEGVFQVSVCARSRTSCSCKFCCLSGPTP